MRKYKIIVIICFLIVLGFSIYVFFPMVASIPATYNEKRDGNKGLSQDELRATSVGEAYISDEVKEHNKNVKHKDVVLEDNLSGDFGPSEVYATPIYGGEAVAKHFKNSSNYYKGEIKLEEAFYNYIPEVMSNTKDMSNTQLVEYYKANPEIIEQRLGIVSEEEFVRFIGSMDKMKNRKFKKINIPSNAITENYTNLSINFLVEFILEDGTKEAPIAVNISHLKSSPNQQAPYIQIIGLYKSERGPELQEEEVDLPKSSE